MDKLLIRVFFLILYAVMAYFTFTGKMMLGMYLMAAGMLLEAILALSNSIRQKQKEK